MSYYIARIKALEIIKPVPWHSREIHNVIIGGYIPMSFKQQKLANMLKYKCAKLIAIFLLCFRYFL